MSLLNGTTYVGEYAARVGSDQADRANRDRQYDSEHYRILCDILAVFLLPASAKKLSHPDPNLELPKTWALASSPECSIPTRETMARPCYLAGSRNEIAKTKGYGPGGVHRNRND